MLLPRCMRHLLSVATAKNAHSFPDDGCSNIRTEDQATRGPDEAFAAEESRDDWKSIVHALNVLRVVFIDATLADDVGPYVTDVSGPCPLSDIDSDSCFSFYFFLYFRE